MNLTRIALAALALGVTFGTAEAANRRAACAVTAAADGTKPAPMSQADLRTKLVADGYTEIRSFGTEDGCVEAKGTDKAGKRFELYLHPVTGAIVDQK